MNVHDWPNDKSHSQPKPFSSSLMISAAVKNKLPALRIGKGTASIRQNAQPSENQSRRLFLHSVADSNNTKGNCCLINK